MTYIVRATEWSNNNRTTKQYIITADRYRSRGNLITFSKFEHGEEYVVIEFSIENLISIQPQTYEAE